MILKITSNKKLSEQTLGMPVYFFGQLQANGNGNEVALNCFSYWVAAKATQFFFLLEFAHYKSAS